MPVGAGTRFIYRIAFEGHGVQRVAERIAVTIIAREAARDLVALKQICEG